MSGEVLAIEMSQRGGSIALGRPGQSPMRLAFGPGTSDEDPLLPAIESLVSGAGLTPRDLAAIAVSAGPGGFTGLRIAMTVTKCMADALSIPVVAVPSALVVAAASTSVGPRSIALASKRDTTWLTATEGDGGAVRIVGEPRIVDASTCSFVHGDTRSRTLLADEHVAIEIIERARAFGLVIEQPMFDAGACWHVGVAMLARGETCDPLRLAPIYPREPEAVTLWRERHPDA